MANPAFSVEHLKDAAGREAAKSVHSGMKLGLGTGSTVSFFLQALGRRLASGELKDIVGVPTSVQTERAARKLGLRLAPLADLGKLDLTVDGADEVDPQLDLIKGLGGALLREKVVAQASRRMLVIVTEDKLVRRLGEKTPLPIEVVPFEWQSHLEWLEQLGADPRLRVTEDGESFKTDNGNFILDNYFGDAIQDPFVVDEKVSRRAGIVESGLFLGIANEAVIAGAAGVRRIQRSEG